MTIFYQQLLMTIDEAGSYYHLFSCMTYTRTYSDGSCLMKHESVYHKQRFGDVPLLKLLFYIIYHGLNTRVHMYLPKLLRRPVS